MAKGEHHKRRYKNAARMARLEMFRLYGTVCWLCGHERADEADHVVPLAVDPDQPFSPHGLRPAHGRKGCPTCGKKCNQSRGNRTAPDPKGSTSRDWYR